MNQASTAGPAKTVDSGGGLMRHLSRLAAVIVLIAAVVVEGYLVVLLRDRIDRQSDEIFYISQRLQVMKNERAGLNETLSSMKKLSGEEKDGHTP